MNSSSDTFVRIDADFISRGIRCSGWLYRPLGVKNPPIIIMAHGFAAEKTFRLPAYAQRFLHEDMAVFLFDYRYIGGSDGKPRGLVNLFSQLHDLQAAIDFVHTLSGINHDKTALWGTSFGGGHVIAAASRDPRIKAIISQVPFVDPFSTLPMVGIKHVMRSLRAGLQDVFRMLTFRNSYYVPVVGKPDIFACMNTPDAESGYMSIVPDKSYWKNECPARILLTMLFYRPMTAASRVKCPALLIMAEKDSLISPKSVQKAAAQMSRAVLVCMPILHFEVYTGNGYEKVVEIEVDFLKKHLN
jgi:cephalosporin-C deacetylase-like acetyl esterase